MALLFYDGFDGYIDMYPRADTHLYPGNGINNTYFRETWNHQWNGPVTGNEQRSSDPERTFRSGYLTGNALHIRVADGSWINDSYIPGIYAAFKSSHGGWTSEATLRTKYRLGAWVKYGDLDQTVPVEASIVFGMGNSGVGSRDDFFGLVLNGHNTGYLTSIPDIIGTVETIQYNPKVETYIDQELGTPQNSAQFTTGFADGQWHFVELFNDYSGGFQRIEIDGQIMATNTATFEYSNSFSVSMYCGCRSDDLGQTQAMMYDHLWLTDGDRPTEKSFVGFIQGVLREAADQPASSPFLNIGGTRYQGRTNGSGALPFAVAGIIEDFPDDIPVAVEVVTSFWPRYPVDDTPWTPDKFDDILQFGIISQPGFSDSTTNQRNSFIGLQYPEVTSDGDIIIRSLRVCNNSLSTEGSTTYNGGTLYETLSDIPQTDFKSGLATDYWATFVNEDDAIVSGMCGLLVDPLTITGLVFSEEYNPDYLDWELVDGGTCFDSYFTSRYMIGNDADKRFQGNYVTVNMENDADGGAYIRGIWDYSTTADTGRWSTQQQLYSQVTEAKDTNYTHFMRRMKIRGNGRVLQYRVDSECGKPYYINGWTVKVTGNEGV